MTDVEIFSDKVDGTASDEFKGWRAKHRRDGYYLNASSRYGWVLHRADCGHAELAGPESLASHRKVCATMTAALRRWLAADGHGTAHRCLTCKPPVLPPVAS